MSEKRVREDTLLEEGIDDDPVIEDGYVDEDKTEDNDVTEVTVNNVNGQTEQPEGAQDKNENLPAEAPATDSQVSTPDNVGLDGASQLEEEDADDEEDDE